MIETNSTTKKLDADEKRCMKCVYHAMLCGRPICEFILITGRRKRRGEQPQPFGQNCEWYLKGNNMKLQAMVAAGHCDIDPLKVPTFYGKQALTEDPAGEPIVRKETERVSWVPIEKQRKSRPGPEGRFKDPNKTPGVLEDWEVIPPTKNHPCRVNPNQVDKLMDGMSNRDVARAINTRVATIQKFKHDNRLNLELILRIRDRFGVDLLDFSDYDE